MNHMWICKQLLSGDTYHFTTGDKQLKKIMLDGVAFNSLLVNHNDICNMNPHMTMFSKSRTTIIFKKVPQNTKI